MEKLKFKVGDKVSYKSYDGSANEDVIIAAVTDSSNHPYIIEYNKGWTKASNGSAFKITEGKLEEHLKYHYAQEKSLTLISSPQPEIINNYSIY